MVKPGTYEYGRLFEHFVILEVIRLNHYYKKNYRLSYLMSKNKDEVDLIITPPKGAEFLIEIKSTTCVQKSHTRALEKFLPLWDRPAKAQLWSQDTLDKKINNTECLHWKTGLQQLFA